MKKTAVVIMGLFLLYSCAGSDKGGRGFNLMGATYKTYYDDGSVKEEVYTINGMLEGPGKTYYPNGQLKEEVTYANNTAEGPAIAYYENGAVKEKKTWLHGKLDGTYTLYCENGNVKEEQNYDAGKLDGMTKRYHDCTTILAETASYADGLLSGERIIYYPDGAVSEKMTYVNGKLSGLKAALYPDGKKKSEEPYLNGEYDGTCRYYDLKGRLFQVVPYVYGEKHGVEKLYYKRGNVQKETPYEYGLIHGTVKNYAGSGYLWLTEEYKMDKPHGKSIQYHKSGRAMKTLTFKNDKWPGQAAYAKQKSQHAAQIQARKEELAAAVAAAASAEKISEKMDAGPDEPVVTDAGYLLRYQVQPNKTWHFASVSEKIVTAKQLKYNFDRSRRTDTMNKVSVNISGRDKQGHLLAKMLIYDMAVEVRTAKGKPVVDCSNVLQRPFTIVMTPRGEEVKINGIDDLKIDIFTKEDEPGKQRDLSDTFMDYFLDLPEKRFKPGDSWQAHQKQTSTTLEGYEQTIEYDADCRFEGIEKINNTECVKMQISTKGIVTLRGEMETGGMLNLGGDLSGKRVAYFDFANGMLVKTTVSSTLQGRMQIKGPNMPKIDMPYVEERKIEMAVVQ